MTPRLVFWASLLAGCLLTAIGLTLTGGAGDDASTIRATQATQAGAQSDHPDDAAVADDAVRTILSRPLFDPARHGTEPTRAANLSGLPRLSGTLITPSGRLAIFVFSEADKPIAVPEGGTIAAFRVESVTPGHAVLAGPDGRHSLQTAFSASIPTPQPQEATK